MRAGPVLLVAALACMPLIAGVTGTLVDAGQQPISGARVCYLAGNVEQLCVNSNDEGFYELPTSPVDRVRIVAEGYLPMTLAAVTQQAPVVLGAAARIWVRLEQGDEGALIEGEIFLVFPSGRRVGPFPANATAGVRINSLEPGKYRVVAKVAGFVQQQAISVTLEPGKEAEVLVPLQEIPTPASPTKESGS